jgi:glycosyltransferase 2 family protein
VELALSTGLVAAGMAGTAAVSAVLLFRIATFWLPVPLGAIALRRLRRRDAV